MIITIQKYERGESTPECVGYIDYPSEIFTEEDAQGCWDICNWSSWSDHKPGCLHADISSCLHGICFVEEYSGTMYLAKSIGWLVGNDSEIADYVKENKDNAWWK